MHVWYLFYWPLAFFFLFVPYSETIYGDHEELSTEKAVHIQSYMSKYLLYPFDLDKFYFKLF